MKKAQLKHKLKLIYKAEEQLFHYLVKEHGADSYKAAYSRGLLAGLEEALDVLEEEDEKEEI